MSNSVWPHRQQPTRLPHPWGSSGKNTGVGCYFLLQCMKVKSESEVTQSCPTPSDPMDCSPPGSSVHRIFQARVLEWGAIAFSDPITSCQIGRETVIDFTFLGSKITANCDYSHEIKKHLLCGRKAMTNLDSILKSRDITSQTKVHIVKAMVFPVVMYRCERTIKKAEHQRIDTFELWCWRKLLKVPWTARRSNQSILRKSAMNIHWKDWC